MAKPKLPVDVNTNVPSIARMYDFSLGGNNNFTVDRIAAEKLNDLVPGSNIVAKQNREFLIRVTTALAQEHGIRQFLDLGSGLPTQRNVHEVVQEIDPNSRVVYVDHDPMTLVHGRALVDNDNTGFVHADMRDIESILENPETLRLLDLDRPTAVLFNSVFHCLKDEDDPASLVRRAMARFPPGSYVVISHLVADDTKLRAELTKTVLDATGGDWGCVRRPDQIPPYFGDLEILPPGPVKLTTWRPETPPGATEQPTIGWYEYGGVARKS